MPKWSAWGDLHSQGCSILNRTGMLFPVNHTPVGNPGLAPGRLGDFKSPGSAFPAEASRREMVGMKGLAPARLPESESGPSAIRVEQHARELALPAGLSPATTTFEASHSDNLSYGSKRMDEGRSGRQRLPWPRAATEAPHRFFNPCSSLEIGGLPRIRTVFSPVKSRDFTLKVCSPDATQRRS